MVSGLWGFMKKAKRFICLAKFIFKFVLSFLLLVFKTIMKEFSIILPYDKFECKKAEHKNVDNNRSNRLKTYVVICAILGGIILVASFFLTSKHRIVTLEILFFFYLLIPFLFKKNTKYFPAVN